ncbi:hypothetical protein AMTRI_Chr02g264240 [Amborella trichopoda]
MEKALAVLKKTKQKSREKTKLTRRPLLFSGRRWEVDLTSEISEDEEDLITRLYKLLGERWDLIAGRLPWRTKEQVESFWRAKTGREHQEQQPTCNPE